MGFEHGFQFQALKAIFATENSEEPNFEKILTALGAASRRALEMRSDFQRAARPVFSSISCAKRSLAPSIRKIYYLVQTPFARASPNLASPHPRPFLGKNHLRCLRTKVFSLHTQISRRMTSETPFTHDFFFLPQV
jgi:hypothetical protein